MFTFLSTLISTLDGRTLLLATTIMASIMGIIILAQRRILPTTTGDSALVGLSNIALAIGTFLMGLRGDAPLWLSLIAGNVTVILGCTLLFVGLRRFDNLNAPLWWITIPPFLALAGFLITDVYNIYVFVVNILMAGLTLGIVWGLIRATSMTVNRSVVTAAIALSGILALARVVKSILALTQMHTDVSTPTTLINGASSTAQLFLSLSVIAVLIWSVGFSLMMNDKVSAHLLQLATHDPMTQTLTRSTFMLLAENAYGRSCRQGVGGAMLMADLDHFKTINDTFGHQAGDEALKAFTQNAKAALRKTDIIARYGGEEFVIFLPDTDKKHALEIAERIRQATYAHPLLTEKGLHQVTVSIGVACSLDPELKLDTLINSADQAMYQAKNTGRNKVCDASMSVAHGALAI